jgi:hypothetical protein
LDIRTIEEDIITMLYKPFDTVYVSPKQLFEEPYFIVMVPETLCGLAQ